MDYCRSVLAVAGANFRRLKRDARVWFIFVFTALLIHYYLRPVINYGIDTGTKAPIYIMELLFCSATISVKAPKILFYIGMLCLLCDAPFFYPLKPYIIMRSKRTAWCVGECIYIVGMALLYTTFILIVSSLMILPIGTMRDSFSGALTDMVLGTGKMSLGEIANIYPSAQFSSEMIRYLYPSGAMMYTFVSVWVSFSILGLFMYWVSLIRRNVVCGMAIAGALVFLDPILVWAAWPNNYWILAFSPVSWTSVEQLNIMAANHFISIPFVIAADALLVIFLFILIFHTAKRISLNGFLTEEA